MKTITYLELISYINGNSSLNSLYETNKDIKSYNTIFDNINSTEVLKLDPIVLEIRKLLWNEITLDEIDNGNVLIYLAIILENKQIIDLVDLKVLIIKLFNHELIDLLDIQWIGQFYLENKDFNDFNTWSIEVYQILTNFGSFTLDIRSGLEVFQAIYPDVDQSYTWNKTESIVNSLKERPEYLEELLNYNKVEDLIHAIPWVNSSTKTLIFDKLLGEKLDNISSTDDYESNIVASKLLSELPFTYPVVKDHITQIDPQTLSSDDYSKIPPNFLQEWMPKFVYSRPDIPLKTKIYFPGGKNIGHSSIILKTSSGIILLDFGLSVVNSSMAYWHPLYEKADVLLLSHAHLDHSGGIPVLLKNDRKLPIFVKKETKILTEMLWKDTSNILSRYSSDKLINNSEISELIKFRNISNSLDNLHDIQIGKEISILPKITIKAHSASHLFGSVGYEINLDGKRLLYTGDFNLDGSVSFKGAEFPSDIDQIIFDGTYYGRPAEVNDPVEKTLASVLKSSNRVIIPAFGMGRSQEMLFQLKKIKADEKWKIYITGMGGKLAKKLGLTVGKSGAGRNSGVTISPTINPDDFTEGTIVIAGQGMLQAGTSRTLFEETANDDKTSVILCGYQAPNTLGNHLANNNYYVKNKFEQQVYRVKMSGHSSSDSLNKYLDNINGTKIIVHSPIEAQKAASKTDIIVPQDFQSISIS